MKASMKTYGLALVLFIATAGIALAQDTTPFILIHSPISGQEYNNEVVEFDVEVRNFTFVDFKNNTVLYPNDPNAGHAHVWIETRLTGEGDRLAYKLLSADFHEVGELDSGNYRLTVELVRNDESQFDPRISNTVTFSVGGDGIQTGRYSVKNRPEPSVEEAPPRRAGVSERFLALIIVLAILTALYIIFRKKLKRFKIVKRINGFLSTFYEKIKPFFFKLYKKVRGILKRSKVGKNGDQ